jgi:TetR/AcrR family transcriptional regulator, regulator of mycofactocin system
MLEGMADLMATLREQRRQAAIIEIANVALRLFVENGFDETSVEEIAAVAGCSPRTFYRYFGTKEDVMLHDIPAMIDRLDEVLDEHLAAGLAPWEATTEALASMIRRFNESAPALPIERMTLWMKEPALRARYVQYVTDAESRVRDRLNRYMDSSPELAALMAAVAIATYRVTMSTHSLRAPKQLESHLRESLAIVGADLGARSHV